MAVNQKALGALENLETSNFEISPYEGMPPQAEYKTGTEPTTKDGKTEFTAAEPLKEVDNYAKVMTQNVSSGYHIPGTYDNDYDYVSGLNNLDLDWTNPTHKNRLLEIQRGAEWNGKGSGISSKGAAGPAQFMKATWDELIQKGVIPKGASRFNEKYAKIAQEYYMDSLYNSNDAKSAATEAERIKRTIAAYNAGPGNLKSALEKAKVRKDENNWLKYLPMPEETVPYLSRILKNFKEKQPLLVMRKLGGVLYKQ